MSYDAEVLYAMRQMGLDPGSIKWTGKLERFPGPGESRRKKNGSGWYTAYPDHPPNVQFGCWKTGVSTSWWPTKNGKREEFNPAQWAELQTKQAEREKEREVEAAKVAKECAQRWENAAEPSPGHPYLEKKGIITFPNVRQEGDGVLIVRMTSFADGNPVVCLQEINAQGEKRFVKGAKALGSRCTLGGARFVKTGEGDLYVCEGYATGWTIHQATGHPVVIAFSAVNLMPVARALREKYGHGQAIIIAADNDRWSMTHRGPNPGVIAAQDAAKEIDAFLSVPDFEDLSTKPTDYNDLMLLEGLDAVREWLDPGRAELARIVAEPGDGGPEPPPLEGEPTGDEAHEPVEVDEGWEDKAPFRCLGYDRDSFFYMPRESGQVKKLSAQQHDRKTLLPLAPLSWWEEMFAAKNGVNWAVAQDALTRTSYQKGVFNYEEVRGRGCWRVEDKEGNSGIVLHLGDRLIGPGMKKFVDPEDYKCPENSIYERLAHLKGPSSKKVMDLEGTGEILRLFQDLLWLDESSALLMAGWTVLAPIGGALTWRPHIWVTGNAGCGKSTVIDQLVRPLLGDMLRYFEGVTTEAGIRQKLGSDSLAVIFDEAEKEDSRHHARIQAIIGLARSASSTSSHATTTKGTRGGTAIDFKIRSMFCWSSVNASLKADSDRQRIAILQLQAKEQLPDGEKNEHWLAYEPRLRALSPTAGAELVARTLAWLRDGRLDETLKTFRTCAGSAMGDPRFGDQYGTLYAGAWTLVSDQPPTEEEAVSFLGNAMPSMHIEETAPEGLRAISALVQRVERVDTSEGIRNISIGELIGIATGDIGQCSLSEADVRLKQLGLRAEIRDGQRVLFIANKSRWIEKALEDTPYTNIHQVLRNLPGVEAHPLPIRFHPGFISRCTIVPFSVFDDT